MGGFGQFGCGSRPTRGGDRALSRAMPPIGATRMPRPFGRIAAHFLGSVAHGWHLGSTPRAELHALSPPGSSVDAPRPPALTRCTNSRKLTSDAVGGALGT